MAFSLFRRRGACDRPFMTTVFVAGATGFTGREVVRLACAAGLSTVAHVRPDSSRLAEWRKRFVAMGAEVDETPWLAEPMTNTLEVRQCDVVFALLGTTKKRGRAAAKEGATETYETIDYGLTALLLQAAVQSSSSPRFVYLSSMGVSATTSNAYLATRHRVETEVAASGLPFCVARPSFIGGERDETRPGEVVGLVVADFALSVVGALGGKKVQNKYRSQDNTTLATALLAMALDEASAGKTFESDELQQLGAH